MNAYLEQLAERVLAEDRTRLESLTLVFPNRRAGLFFQKHLAARLQDPVWSPRVLTIEEFIASLSPLTIADPLLLVFELFEEYKALVPTDESFDKFFIWGEMLLNDLDAVDKYLVKADSLFVNISQLKELDNVADYLTEEQVEVIRAFWRSFGSGHSAHQQHFINIWEVLAALYQRFRLRLLAKTDPETGAARPLAYEGMVFRDVAERLLEGNLKHDYQQLLFAGFDALNPAEERILAHFIKEENARIDWNVDAYYLLDTQQEAGRFLRRYANHPVFGKSFPHPFPANLQRPANPPTIELVAVPMEIGQAKAAGQKLLECLKADSSLELERTALVLPDEHLLFPVLHALPDAYTTESGQQKRIADINVTMGYPLADTPLYSLMEHLLALQLGAKQKEGKSARFPYRTVLSLLRHPYLYYQHAEEARELIQLIETQNRLFLPASLFTGVEGFKRVFQATQDVNALFEYLLDVLTLVNDSISEEQFERPTIEQEYIYQFYTQLKRLYDLVKAGDIALSEPVFIRLFRQLMQRLKLPFAGEPLKGLQVMGMLETRNLDFDNIFLLSANEGTLPPAPGHHSFIPYNLRRAYGLPTFDDDDARFAWVFYSMLQRAKHVRIFYNTETAHGLKGELSRFVQQLRYESGLEIKEQVLANPARIAPSQPITIEKTPEVLQELNRYLLRSPEDQPKRLAPTAILSYLDCRLKFYFKKVARLMEADEVQAEVDAPVFGNLLHRSLELAYETRMQQKGSRLMEVADFETLEKELPQAIQQAFAEHYGLQENESMQHEGKNLLAAGVIEKFSRKILACDRDYAPFEIVALESKTGRDTGNAFDYDFPIGQNGSPVKVALKGIIDRIDRQKLVDLPEAELTDDEARVRVLDYKTGRDEKAFSSLEELFEREGSRRNKAAFQTFFYGMLYSESPYRLKGRIIPGLYNSRELFAHEGFDIHLIDKSAKKGARDTEGGKVKNYLRYDAEFRELLGRLLTEMFDPAVAFSQTEDVRICSYCPYNAICQR